MERLCTGIQRAVLNNIKVWHKISCFFLFILTLPQCELKTQFQNTYIWAPSSEFVSSSIPSLQISTVHAQPFRGARDLVFCLKVPLDSVLVWASSEGSGETARMCRLAWTFAANICDKYQIRLTRSISKRIYIAAKFGFFTQSVLNFKVFQAFIILIFKENKYQHKSFAICKHDMKKQNNKKNCIISILMITDDNFQIRRVFDDNFCQFSIKTYVVGTH